MGLKFYWRTKLSMACCKTSDLLVSYNNIAQTIDIGRCCQLTQKTISLEDFLNKNLDDLGELAISHEFKEGHDNQCQKNCAFSKHIKNITLNIIRACNLRCYHCCAGFDGIIEGWSPLNKEQNNPLKAKEFLFKMLNLLKNSNIDTLFLDGSGEIFIYYNDLVEYLNDITSDNIKNIFFMTNGTLLDEDKINQLYEISKKTGVNYQFNLSIDGIKEGTFSKCRPGADFNKVILVLKKLNELFGSTLVTFTVKRPNIGDVPQVEEFFKNLGSNVLWSSDYFDEEYCSKYVPLNKRWD